MSLQLLSENEELTYEWSIPDFKDGYSYLSPTFGLTSKDISAYHLEIKTNFFLQNKMSIYLYSSTELNGWKFTFTGAVKEGMYPLPNIYCSFNWCDFKPPVKVFEIESYRTGRTFSSRFTFRLDLKLRKDVKPTTSISNSKISLQASKMTNRGKFDMLNKEPNSTKNYRCSNIIKFFPEGRSPYSSGIEEKDKSSPDQTISELLQQNKEGLENAQHLGYPKELIQDFRFLYTSGHMCDLEIRIGESVLRAHKSILCARSSVFKAMMEHDCLESSSNCISITDFPPSPFDTFLKYLYTGEIEDRTMDTVMTLYSLSDKYDVPALREACSNILHNKLSSKSVDDIANIVCDVLQLADCHNDLKLKDLAASFISSHFSVVSNKQSWKDLMKSNFELTSEILAIVVNICQKIQT